MESQIDLDDSQVENSSCFSQPLMLEESMSLLENSEALETTGEAEVNEDVNQEKEKADQYNRTTTDSPDYDLPESSGNIDKEPITWEKSQDLFENDVAETQDYVMENESSENTPRENGDNLEDNKIEDHINGNKMDSTNENENEDLISKDNQDCVIKDTNQDCINEDKNEDHFNEDKNEDCINEDKPQDDVKENKMESNSNEEKMDDSVNENENCNSSFRKRKGSESEEGVPNKLLKSDSLSENDCSIEELKKTDENGKDINSSHVDHILKVMPEKEINLQTSVDKITMQKLDTKSSNESANSVSILSGKKINLVDGTKDLDNKSITSDSVEVIDKSDNIETINLIDTSSSENSVKIINIDSKDSLHSNDEDSKPTELTKDVVTNESETLQIASTMSIDSDNNFTEELLNQNHIQTNDHVISENGFGSGAPSPVPSEKNSDVLKSDTEKGKTSTPNIVDEKQSDSFKSDSTLETHSMNGYKINDINDSLQNSVVKRHVFYVEVIYTVNDQSKLEIKKEISQINCEDISEMMNPKRISDHYSSTGALGDVSKNNSPNSSGSGSTALFQLPNRFSTISNASRLSSLSRFSTSSTSSVLSSASALASKLREEHFLVPEVPLINKSKDKISSVTKPISNDQIEVIKSHWSNSDQLFKILEAIDNSSYSGRVSDYCIEKASPQQQQQNSESITKAASPAEPIVHSKLEKIEEVSTPKSEKRSVRKKRTTSKVSDEQSSSDTPSSHRNTTTEGSARRTKRSNSANQRLATPEPINYANSLLKQEVFARWTDRKYYSGVVDEHVKDNKWIVKFDDGNKKILIEDYIISGCHSNLKGHSVYALVNNGEYDTGIVTQLTVNRGKIYYQVEVDSGKSIKVSAKDLFLTEDQAKALKEINISTVTPPSTPKHTVSLDNIVEGKRSTRANKKYSDNAFSPRPGVSGTRKMTPRKLDSEDEKSIDSKSECAAIEEIGGVEPELKIKSTPAKANKGPGKIKGTTKRAKRLPKYKMDAISTEFGPIPHNSSLFEGLSFLLVCVNSSIVNREEKISSETETDNEMMEFAKVPFLEEHLREQIIAGGGIIYSHFEEIPANDYHKCKLISNRPNRTAKYIQCVAAGIMVVCHEWVINCCRENKRLSFQELPLGWSIEENKFIESFKRKDKKPFENLLIYLAPNTDGQFLKFWERVCTLAGGTVIIIDDNEVDFQTAAFLLADNECPEQVVDRALNWGIPLLSTTWIVQSIVYGECRPYDGHLKYAYDCIEYD